jgi:DNA-binding NarL/FixJ family response regulator
VWVNVTVSLVSKPDGKPDYLVSVVEDISDRVMAQAELRANHEALEAKNIALREVVAQIDAEKRELHQTIRSNIERTVKPIILRLRKGVGKQDLQLIEQLENNLEQIVSPMTRHLETEFSALSPRELEICSLIRNGMTSKEIADSLHLSQETVNKFRHFIRKKLGITNEEVNLRSYLRLMDKQYPK